VLTVRELADLAGVDPAFVETAVSSGALGLAGPEQLTADHESAIRLLKLWETAGFSIEAIGQSIEQGKLSFSFLDAPSLRGLPRLDLTYLDYARERSLDPESVVRLQEALGLEPPNLADAMREGEPEILELLTTMVSVGFGQDAVLRIFRVYADALRRLGQAEAELFEAEIEGPGRAKGVSEQELLDLGVQIGHQVVPLMEKAILAIYRRHRHHVWLDHTIGHVEGALGEAGLDISVARPPSVVFVDLTGFTHLTEELGDEAAAEMSGKLASMVGNIAMQEEGRPVRWLGDGGMFVFREPESAVLAGLKVVEEAPRQGLPPTHIGIHTGPVIFQDGDIYGRTVNMAARLSAMAGPDEVLVSRDVVDRLPDGFRFESVGPVELKGFADPIDVFRTAPAEPAART
jgi:class 3 adenylate cyclase